MRSVLVAAVLVLVGLYAFARYARSASMFFPSRYPEGSWETTAEDHWYKAADGVKLHGWLFRARNPEAPLVVWLHGNGGNITDRAPTAATLAERGLSVFLAEYRGYGRSEGQPTESGLYLDALAAPIPLGWMAPRAMATKRWLNHARVPVLVMHGKRDQVIPYQLGVALYEGLTVPKEMLTSETAGHSEIPSAEGLRYYDTVVKFVTATDTAARTTLK